MGTNQYRSWAYQPDMPQFAFKPGWQSNIELADYLSTEVPHLLPFGNGRSYGDSCLNNSGAVIDTRKLDHVLSIDTELGTLTAEAGITFDQILEIIAPLGWFLPVTPGTAYITLGGAIANDVHGKNHHRDGSFAQFIEGFDLLRSNGDLLHCSASENTSCFNATIGGMGLTGLVLTASIRLMPISSSIMNIHTEAFTGLDQFAEISNRYRDEYQYTVAWLDCTSSGSRFARGLFFAANHSIGDGSAPVTTNESKKRTFPVALPKWALNRYSVKAFNEVYYRAGKRHHGRDQSQAFRKYFYPLDAIDRWNRIYGNKGFYQFQFVVPVHEMPHLKGLLSRIVKSGIGSFLAVLKEFGDIRSPGYLSFPRPGYCLALDFANRGKQTENLLRELESQVMAAGGAVYPAKDRLMSSEAFAQYFEQLPEFLPWVDPAFSSDFWRRVHG